MKKRFAIFMVIGIIVSFCHMLSAKQQVGRIVGGENGCTVQRMENGTLETLNAKYEMALYPGDIIRKPGGIDSVQIEFRPYAKKKRRDKNSLLIVSKTPEKREDVFTKFKKMLGLVEAGFYETSGAYRSLLNICFPGESSTIVPGQAVVFSNCRNAEAIVFKELGGKEIFRKNIKGNEISLIPEKIGMAPYSTYTWELVNEKEVLYRAVIKVLDRENGDLIKKDLSKIDQETISDDEKKVKKAAYFQFMSDLYPGTVNLYWLSYRLLRDVNQDKNKKIKKAVEHLKYRFLDHLNGAISEVDFAAFNSPACMVAIEWEKDGVKKNVSPNFSFHEDESFWIHFQTNFYGYAVILYQDKDGPTPVFPTQKEGIKVEAKTDRYSHECQLDGNAGNETFMFILSKKSVKEMEQLQRVSDTGQKKLLNALNKRAKEKGRQLKVKFIGTKAFVTASQKELEGLTWFRLVLKNMGKE
jgi:hypothetical protein